MFYCLGVIVHSMQPLKLDMTKLVVSGATQSGCESEGTGLWGATRQICSLLSSHVRVWMSVGLVPQGLALLTTIIVPLAPEKACPGGVQHLLCTWNITLLLLKFASPLKVWTSIPTEGDLAILNPGRGTLLLTQISSVSSSGKPYSANVCWPIPYPMFVLYVCQPEHSSVGLCCPLAQRIA